MANLIPVHSMLVELHSGMLVLAVICIFATIAARSHGRMRRTSESYGVFWPADSFMGKIGRYAESTAYVAGIVGVIGIIFSAIVGFYVWPIDLVTSSNLGLNKIMFSVFALELWAVFVFLRSKYGENLWRNVGTATVYSLTGIFGFVFIVLTGSLGGHMAGIGSILDPVYTSVGVDPVKFGFTGYSYVVVLVSVSIVAIAVPIAAFHFLWQRAKPAPVKPVS